MSKIEQTVQARLFELQDLKYRDVQCKLMPTVDPETVIGVRTPELRKLAKSFSKEPEAEASCARCLTNTTRKTTSTAF